MTLFHKNKLTLIILITFLCAESSSSPIGKGLACQNNVKLESSNYQMFKGLFFETNKSVRVVSFKMKNNSLKVISKQTPYKISENKIDFKIKFIWYGNISFEKYSLDRQALVMNYENNNDNIALKCRIIRRDFMTEMNEIKSYFQMRNEKNTEFNKSL